METFKIYFLKILKKLKLNKYFNFKLTKNINGVKVKIPFFGEIGLVNMLITKEWLDLLIEKFAGSNTYNTNMFVDVGVNIGQSLLRLKTLYPDAKYLGFEPNSTCTVYVSKLIKANCFKNCTVLNAALSNKVDILTLEKTSEADPRASLVTGLRPNMFKNKETVLALNYDSFYLDEKINFVKIDVEGAEYEVLKGMEEAIVRHQPIITCEVLDSHSVEVLEFTQIRAAKLGEMLKNWKYNIIRLETRTLEIVSFEKVTDIEIVQWTPASCALNDYLFYPENMEKEVLEKLSLIVKKQ